MAAPPSEIDLELQELETRLERLRALYEQYFLGIERLEPSVPRQDVERRIHTLRTAKIRNTAKRFRLQNIIQRYNTFQQYWLRICREIDNGTYHRHLARAKDRFGDVKLSPGARRRARMRDDEAEPEAAVDKARAVRQAEDDLESLLREDPEQAMQAALASATRAVHAASAAQPAIKQVSTAVKSSEAPIPAAPALVASSAGPGAPSRPSAAAPPRLSAGGPPRPSAGGPPRPSAGGPPPLPRPSRTDGARPPVPSAAARSRRADVPADAVETPRVVPAPQAANDQTQPAARANSWAALRIPSAGAGRRADAPTPGAAKRPRPASPAADRRVGPARAPSAPVQPPPGLPRGTASAKSRPSRKDAPGATASRARKVAESPPQRATARGATPASTAGLDQRRVHELHGQLVAERRRLNQSGKVPVDTLAKSLRATEAKLRKQYAGEKVDFRVVVKNGKAVVKPVVG